MKSSSKAVVGDIITVDGRRVERRDEVDRLRPIVALPDVTDVNTTNQHAAQLSQRDRATLSVFWR